MRHVREMTELVDCFIAPARYLRDRYRDEFGLPASKLVHLDYGFDLARLRGRRVHRPAGPFVFGYISTHIPAKGVQDLIRAFGAVAGEISLRIWGRARGQNKEALKALARNLPSGAAERVEWRQRTNSPPAGRARSWGGRPGSAPRGASIHIAPPMPSGGPSASSEICTPTV